MSGETAKGTQALAEYLNDFPNGMFRLNAQFYKAYADLNLEKFDEALVGFEEVIAKPNNFFTEKALLTASQLNYRKGNYGKGKEQYARLKVVAENPENVNVAKVGYMRCLYELKEYAACLPAADEVIGMPKIQEEVLREARYKKVKSNLVMGKDNAAIKELELLSKEVQSAEGSEAKYLLAKVYFNSNKYDEAEKEINQFIEMNSPHHYWLAESFLLLSDVYMKKDNVFDARYTLQSIIDNYGVKDDGIINRAQQKLNQILAAEKQKEEQIQKQAEQVEFEGANNAKNQKLFDKEEVKNDSVGLDEERMMLEEMLKTEETKVE
jgi:outer membrane protein assembly factor BamD (BamD/ComL family)